MLAEGLDEAFLLLTDMVDPDAVEAELGEFDEPVAQMGRIGRDQDPVVHVLGAHVTRRFVEVGRQLEVPAHRGREHVGPPLVVGDGQRLVVGVGPRHVDLQVARLARPTTGVERGEDLAEHIRVLVDRDQPVGPGPGELGGSRRHGGADQLRHLRGNV